MENKKDKVTLNDELLDKVSGGVIINGEHYGLPCHKATPCNSCPDQNTERCFNCPNK